MCSLFDAPNSPRKFKALERMTITLIFVGTLLYESGWRKRTETQNKAGNLWVPANCELSSSHQASQSGANVIQKQPVTKQKRKEFLVRDPCGQGVMGVPQGKMKQE